MSSRLLTFPSPALAGTSGALAQAPTYQPGSHGDHGFSFGMTVPAHQVRDFVQADPGYRRGHDGPGYHRGGQPIKERDRHGELEIDAGDTRPRESLTIGDIPGRDRGSAGPYVPGQDGELLPVAGQVD